jgi:hypothetical protein
MDTCDDAPIRVAFHENDHVGTRDYLAFAAQWLAYVLPCRRFAATLTGASARLGADAGRYSFIVVDLHHLLLAGFDRRTEIQDCCNSELGRKWRGFERRASIRNKLQCEHLWSVGDI